MYILSKNFKNTAKNATLSFTDLLKIKIIYTPTAFISCTFQEDFPFGEQ